MTTIDVESNLRRTLDRIAGAARRAGRHADEVTLVAVSKFHPPEAVLRAANAGHRDFGENYPQELWTKATAVGLGQGPVRWHLIGHLQRNKVARVVPHAALVHSVDSARLAEALDVAGRVRGAAVPVLLEVNVSREPSKHGFAAEDLPALGPLIAGSAGLQIEGLMGMGAHHDDPAANRTAFAALRGLRDRLRGEWGLPLPHLSMGMSSDFEVAVEEGATIVRVGTAIFGPRHYSEESGRCAASSG
jgi:pyridoxal phosphate enzyme (YggS family)